MHHSSSAPITDLKDRLMTLRSAFLDQPEPSLTDRLRDLRTLKLQIQRHHSALCDAVQQDFGRRAHAETKIAELVPVLETLDYIQHQLKQWMQPKKRTLSWLLKPAQAWVHYQPLGVVGIMSPWNYPIQLTLIPLIYALAAGNRVFLKLSEYTPHTAHLLEKLLSDIFPQDKVSLICGDVEISEAFAKLPFDHLFFTGATSTGKKIMGAAAENLTPVTLELGGKSPVIIGPDADIAAACHAIAFGKSINAGQTCIAPDVLLCTRKDYEAIVKQLTQSIQQLYPKGIESEDYTNIISKHHLARLDHLLADAQKKGARITALNPASELLTHSNKRPITLVSDLQENMAIAQDEIFGPWLAVVIYNKLDEAISYVNQRPRPLALYYFGQTTTDIQKIIQQTRSGGVCVNDMLSHVAASDLPFGGIGASGMGQYHGPEGFQTFSHAKPIYQKGFINPIRWIYPPWNKRIQKLLFDQYFHLK